MNEVERTLGLFPDVEERRKEQEVIESITNVDTRTALKLQIKKIEKISERFYNLLLDGIPVSTIQSAVLDFNIDNLYILLEHSGVARVTPAKTEISIPANSITTTTFTLTEPYVCIQKRYGPVTTDNFGKVHYAVYVDSPTANVATSAHILWNEEYGDFGQFWNKRDKFYVKAWNFDTDYASNFQFYYKGMLLPETFWDGALREQFYYYSKIARII